MGKRATTLFAGAIAILTLGSVQAALESRLGGQAYYDTVLDITWLQDANYAVTSGYAAANAVDNGSSAYDNIFTDGRMGWDAATAWADQLVFGGYEDWRLPTIVDTGTSGCNSAYSGTDCGYNVQTGSAATTVYSEMASLWYDTLGNLAFYDTSGTGPQTGWGLANTGPFSNLQSSVYWSGTEYAPDTNYAWRFITYDGAQGLSYKDSERHAWAVRSGDVSAVPVPAAVWLFGTALVGLVGWTRRKR